MKKQKHQGIQVGIVCLTFGTIFAIADTIMFMNGKVFPVMIALAPPLTLVGIGFLIVPGYRVAPEVPEKERPKEWWKKSSKTNKLVWIMEMLTGLAIGIWLMISFTKFG